MLDDLVAASKQSKYLVNLLTKTSKVRHLTWYLGLCDRIGPKFLFAWLKRVLCWFSCFCGPSRFSISLAAQFSSLFRRNLCYKRHFLFPMYDDGIHTPFLKEFRPCVCFFFRQNNNWIENVRSSLQCMGTRHHTQIDRFFIVFCVWRWYFRIIIMESPIIVCRKIKNEKISDAAVGWGIKIGVIIFLLFFARTQTALHERFWHFQLYYLFYFHMYMLIVARSVCLLHNVLKNCTYTNLELIGFSIFFLLCVILAREWRVCCVPSQIAFV